MTNAAKPQQHNVQQWLIEPLAAEVADSIERLTKAEDVRHLAIMPDVHLAHEVCVGVAMATKSLLYPAAVGSDIGCGMAAVAFHASADRLASERAAAAVLASLYEQVPAIRHSRANMPTELPADLQQTPLSDPKLEKLESRDGRVQLGTLGRGNHFLEFQSDADDKLWLMIHSGSRGMGQAIATHHRGQCSKVSKSDQFAAIVADSLAGVAYLNDVAWAEQYAAQNRLKMITAVAEIMDRRFNVAIDESSLIHSNHNHVRRETHFGEAWWVHRKGALSAAEGELGVIPGSMGTASFHVAGRGCQDSLMSSSHGAGRSMSRGDAMKSIKCKRLFREMDGIWFDHRQARRLCDEAPSAYKDIHQVMRAQHALTKIVRELRPVLNYKGC